MKKIKLIIPVLALFAMFMSCEDFSTELEVANLDNPDDATLISDPTALVATSEGIIHNWFMTVHSTAAPGAAMQTMADISSCSWGNFGMRDLFDVTCPASNYGLSMILGGAEVNLLELTASYAAWGNQLTDSAQETFISTLLKNRQTVETTSQIVLDNGSIYTTLSALTNTYRPDLEAYWKNFSSGRKTRTHHHCWRWLYCQ